MSSRFLMVPCAILSTLCLASPLRARVDYGKDSPWDQRAESGPDAQVPGWFYNLGITGLRAKLIADEPKALLIKYVFPNSPADGHVKYLVDHQEKGGSFGDPVHNTFAPLALLASGDQTYLPAVEAADRAESEIRGSWPPPGYLGRSAFLSIAVQSNEIR